MEIKKARGLIAASRVIVVSTRLIAGCDPIYVRAKKCDVLEQIAKAQRDGESEVNCTWDFQTETVHID